MKHILLVTSIIGALYASTWGLCFYTYPTLIILGISALIGCKLFYDAMTY